MDYYTQCCQTIDNITEDEKQWIDQELNRVEYQFENIENEKHRKELVDKWMADRGLIDEDADTWPSFQWDFESDCLVISAEEHFNTDHIIAFVQHFFQLFRPKEVFMLEWANTASRTVVDAFGGGVMVVTAKNWECETTNLIGSRLQEKLEKELNETDGLHPSGTDTDRDKGTSQD